MGVIIPGGATETRVEKGLMHNPVPIGPVEDISPVQPATTR